MKTIEEVNKELDESIPKSAVKQRQGGGGRQLSYLEGHYVIDRLNKIFGPLSWSSSIVDMKLAHSGTITRKDNFGKERITFSSHYTCQVKLTVKHNDSETSHTCIGYGDGEDPLSPGKSHELAVKEAETDALKRCAKNLGQSMGLALYDKTQANVVDDNQRNVVEVLKEEFSKVTNLTEAKGFWDFNLEFIGTLPKNDQEDLLAIKEEIKKRFT